MSRKHSQIPMNTTSKFLLAGPIPRKTRAPLLEPRVNAYAYAKTERWSRWPMRLRAAAAACPGMGGFAESTGLFGAGGSTPSPSRGPRTSSRAPWPRRAKGGRGDQTRGQKYEEAGSLWGGVESRAHMMLVHARSANKA